MKKKSRSRNRARAPAPSRLPFGCVVGAALWVGASLWAEEEPDTASIEGTEEPYANWVELSLGGMSEHGSRSQAEESLHRAKGLYGGLSDFHYQYDTEDLTTYSVDGRALFDQNDYRLTLGMENFGRYFLRFHFENDRTWSNGDGGYYPPGGIWYPLDDEALELDRGELSFEAGLSLENLPKFHFKYSHLYREGEKGSTIWGQTHPLFTPVTRGLGPAFYDLDEQRDIFELDAQHQIKSTDFGLGLRYESGDLDNARKVTQWPGEPAIERDITHREGSSYDLFNIHAFSETWIKPDLLFSTGFLFANLDNDLSGSRIYGGDFDVGYTPDPLNGAGFLDLDGQATKHEYALNLNLMATPIEHLAFVPSVRVRREDWDADSLTASTLGTTLSGPITSESDGDLIEVRERLDARYTGFTNWVLHARAELTQGEGNLEERGGIYLGSPIQRETDDERFFQKYSAGVRWYPIRRVSVDLGGYYKQNSYDYDHRFDDTDNALANRYPAYLVTQDFETYDGNARLTLRPRGNVNLVTRYDYQWSTIHTQPDSVTGLGDLESSVMNTHVFAQTVSWSPWSRLYLQSGFNLVLSETETPASAYTQAILDAENNYWTIDFNPRIVLDAKTDLSLGYVYYRASNYEDNSNAGVPYGAGATEHIVSGLLTRRFTDKIRLSLRYAYFNYEDELSGGNNDFEAHSLMSSLQYRF